MAHDAPPDLAADLLQARCAWSRQFGDAWLTETQWILLRRYIILLHVWSGRMSLVSQQDRDRLGTRHLLPSLAWLPLVASLPRGRILDLGSGAGLPGLPLAVALPDSRVYLIESRRRRASFLREVVRRLGLRTISIIHGRAEDWSGPDGGVDLVVSRAVGDPQVAMRLAGRAMAAHAHGLVLCGRAAPKAERDPACAQPHAASTAHLALATPAPGGPQVVHLYPHSCVDNPPSQQPPCGRGTIATAPG
ncbi:MAG: 16S rRNA (guanine(527)-N(7))-methyltransferase RsmG [Candidatus Latescibacterota bacterium]